jgi:hypothetical protein
MLGDHSKVKSIVRVYEQDTLNDDLLCDKEFEVDMGSEKKTYNITSKR